MELHLDQLKLVLSTLREHQLVAKLSKCAFGQETVDYLGHVLSQHGLTIDPSKITTIQQWPAPRNIKEVRNF